MTKAKWGGELRYEDSRGRTHVVKTETDLDARLIQDIMLRNLGGNTLETEAWLVREVDMANEMFRQPVLDALERIKAYLNPKSNFVDVLWQEGVIPVDVVAKVMKFMDEEGKPVKWPRKAEDMT